MRESSQPTVMSVSTLSRPTCLPASMPRRAICAPISGTPVASMTMSTGRAVSRARVVDRDGAALGDDAGELVVVVARDHVLDAGGLEGAGGALHVDVGDGDDLHAGDLPDLGDESPAHLPGADQTDPDRAPRGRLAVEEAFAVCHFGFS